MKDIEDRLQEEYDKVEVPDYMFDTSRVFKRVRKEKNKTKSIVIASVASSIVILLIVLIIIIIPKGNNDEKTNIPQKAESNIVNAAGSININNNVSGITIYKEKMYILLIKLKKIETYEIIDNIPYTKVKAEIINSYLGDTSKEIEIYIPGGVFKVEDLKEKVKMPKETTIELSKFSDEDYIEATYYNEVFIPIAKENNTYIATLYLEENEYYVDMNKAYGFKEYDPETNIVKDDTGDEPLQIDKYLENITK